jgi:hypothetical protein
MISRGCGPSPHVPISRLHSRRGEFSLHGANWRLLLSRDSKPDPPLSASCPVAFAVNSSLRINPLFPQRSGLLRLGGRSFCFRWHFVGSSRRVFRCSLRGAVPSPVAVMPSGCDGGRSLCFRLCRHLISARCNFLFGSNGARTASRYSCGGGPSAGTHSAGAGRSLSFRRCRHSTVELLTMTDLAHRK